MDVLGKSKEELRAMCAALGEPPYRGGQIYHALYRERNASFATMTNLPAAFRARLEKEATITVPIVRQRYASMDGSVRYLFSLHESESTGKGSLNAAVAERTEKKKVKSEAERIVQNSVDNAARSMALPASVEAVFMPSEGRQTICVSTQAGCAVNCQFCLTAQLGLIRNLTAGEILGQFLLPIEEQKERLAPQTNVVLMGQGEPLLNFDPVIAALRIMLDPEGIGLSPKHVTLSTSGIVPGIERLAAEKVRPKLAISLNASNDEERDALMPINKKYPLDMLLDACKRYPLRPWEHLTFEYVMLGGVNDAPEDARRVVRLLAPLKSVKLNLIPWNPGDLPYQESSPEQIEEFRRILNDKGVPAFVRYSRGRDVMAACGQLALMQIRPSTTQISI